MTTSAKIRRLAAKGKTPQEVAKALKISPNYVYTILWLDKKKKKKAVFKSPRSKLIQAVFQAKREVEAAKAESLQLDSSGHFRIGVTAPDIVNHPPHYKAGGIETLDFIEAKDLNYRLGNVVKYVSRAGKKDTDPVQDLEKAMFYLKREIEARKNA
jgi:hypothetical protein